MKPCTESLSRSASLMSRCAIFALCVALMGTTACGSEPTTASSSQIEIDYVESQSEDELFFDFIQAVYRWFSSFTTPPEPEPANENLVDRSLYAKFTHVGQRVIDVLESDFIDDRYTGWNASNDTGFASGWVMQTPAVWHTPALDVPTPDSCNGAEDTCDPDFLLRYCASNADCVDGGICTTLRSTVSEPGQEPYTLCVGHSDSFYDAMYTSIVAAEDFVDITSLSPPDGRFKAAIRNAVTYVGHKGRDIVVRFLVGDLPGMQERPNDVLEDLVRDVPANSSVRVYVGAYRVAFNSWNHSKIIAVDGREMITGGHNLWTEHYLTVAPVHDLSMRVEGTPAVDGHRFINAMWDHICDDWFYETSTERSVYPEGISDCPPRFEPGRTTSEVMGSPVISVGRMGALGENAADEAMLAMVKAAQSSLRMSLQDIGPVQIGDFTLTSWPDAVLRELSLAVVRGVDIYMVLSSPNSIPGGLTAVSANYGNGWTQLDVANALYKWMTKNPDELPAGVDVRSVLCDRLHSAVLRFSEADEQWPDNKNIGNHAKFFIVDDVAFYLGSQNLYPSNLSEFGLIVDDAAITSEILTEYWHPLWTNSGRTSVSGFEAEHCEL